MQEGSVVRELMKCCSKQVHIDYHRRFSINCKVKGSEESVLSKLEEISVRPVVRTLPAMSELVSQQHPAIIQPSTENRLNAGVSSEPPTQTHPQVSLPDPDNFNQNQNLEQKVLFNQIQNAKEVYSNKERIGATHP